MLPVDNETVEAVAQLRNRCRLIGYALHQRGHNADLWIAATSAWVRMDQIREAFKVGVVGLANTDVARRRQLGKHSSHSLLSLGERIKGPRLEPRPYLPKEQLNGPPSMASALRP